MRTWVAPILSIMICASLSAQHPGNQSTTDLDADGLPDQLEQELAEKFAPIVFHEPDEPNLPTTVALFLAQTELWSYDDRCQPKQKKIAERLSNSIPFVEQPPCDSADDVMQSQGTRSQNKNRTFFLKNVSKVARAGSLEPNNWATYFHCYPNQDGGMTIQYWRFHAFNTGQFLGLHISIGDHGGDWEAVHIVLNSSHVPVAARFLGHRDMATKKWSELNAEGSHLLMKSEKGGHTSVPMKAKKGNNKLIRHETWSGGKILCPAKSPCAGPEAKEWISPSLVNLGEKTYPAKDMDFIQFSGLWGSRRTTWFFPRLRSGYWGPANNETGMHRDNFIAAWCEGMSTSLRERTVSSNSRTIRECYPTKPGR